ncbi:MAG: hypothetical protein M3O36_01700 [Myxococcota bacterium]|nr:hypothetical protein [Myxococcota bacterium]
MILSRLWYVLLALAVAVALYVVYVAVGQYGRQTTRALKEGLASDSQTVEWVLKIDARHRLDALLAGSVEPALQQALVGANGSVGGKVPEKSRADAKRALATIHEAIPADWRADALFAVDREGRVVASRGYEAAAGNDEFEMGGYPAVNDALHGWLRDDIWVLGSKMYVVVARPVEYDATQRPVGAIVGLKEVSAKLADDIARRTRTNVAFFALGRRVAAGAWSDGFDREKLDAVSADLKNVDDKTYGEGGRSDVRMLSDDLGTMYARLPGDVWALGGGFAVVRGQSILAGPMGFLSNADDKDKANVPWALLAAVVLLASLVGVALTLLEHTIPLRELLTQGARFETGAIDGLQVARFRGAYRVAAQRINRGVERAIEQAGGMTRKPADLESILGPTPTQPAMSAFSFPLSDGSSQGSQAGLPPQPLPTSSSYAGPSPGPPPFFGAPSMSDRVPSQPSRSVLQAPAAGRPATPPRPVPPPMGPSLTSATYPAGLSQSGPLPGPFFQGGHEDEDATMVGAAPADVMARAISESRPPADSVDWHTVYDEFMRTKRQCGESTEGLSYEKFSHTLKKNRDVLVARHACKRVKFTVYVKDGRASLKATPIKE